MFKNKKFNFVTILLICASFVIASILITPTSFNPVEDVTSRYNITVNVTEVAATANITQVNITLPSSFTFLSGSNATTATNGFFSNTSTILTWTNSSGLVMNVTANNFLFNATASTPGYFNLTVVVTNATTVNSTNITVQINDTTAPATVSFNSPTSGTNISRTEIYLNATATDNLAVNVVRIYLFNATRVLINQTNSTSTTSAIMNTSGLAEGVYYANITANDTTGNQNLTGTNIVIRLDTSAPTNLSFGSSNPANGVNTSLSEFTANASITDSASSVVVRFYLFNSTGIYNQSNVTTTDSATYNFSGIANGLYMLNITAADTAGNLNETTISRFIRVDTITPTITLTRSSTSTQNKLIINISISESGSGINGICSTNRAGASVTGSGSTVQTSTEDILACGNSYSYIVTCVDYSGNSGASSSSSFTTDDCSSSSSSGSGGSSTNAGWKNTYTISNAQFTSGYTISLSANEQVRFTIKTTGSSGISGTENHYAGVKSLTTTTANIEVRSTTQTATMSVGETKKFDTDGDGNYDTQITLNSISGGKANFTISSIIEKTLSAQPSGISNSSTVTNDTSDSQESVGEESQSSASKTWVYVIIIVLVLGVAAYLLKDKFKKKNINNKVRYRKK